MLNLIKLEQGINVQNVTVCWKCLVYLCFSNIMIKCIFSFPKAQYLPRHWMALLNVQQIIFVLMFVMN